MEIILLIVCVLIAYYGYMAFTNNKFYKKLKEQGANVSKRVAVGKYIGGHPDIDKAVTSMEIIQSGSKLIINGHEIKKTLAEIDSNKIADVCVDDATTMQSRVTVGRLLLVGIFAFAMKKKTKNELAYITLKWNDGRFNHETIFEFEGHGAMQRANTSRNAIIKLMR